MLVDSHCHLDFPDFDGELDGIVSRARAAGITRIVTISTRVKQHAEVVGVLTSKRMLCILEYAENRASLPEISGNGIPPGKSFHGSSNDTLCRLVRFPQGAEPVVSSRH